MNERDWEKEIEKLRPSERARLLKALDELKSWKPFEREFSGSEMFDLITLLLR